MASTANEMRRERYEAPVDPEKMKAAADGISRSKQLPEIDMKNIFFYVLCIISFTERLSVIDDHGKLAFD